MIEIVCLVLHSGHFFSSYAPVMHQLLNIKIAMCGDRDRQGVFITHGVTENSPLAPQMGHQKTKKYNCLLPGTTRKILRLPMFS